MLSLKVPANMRKIRRFRSPCACAKYYLGICSSFIYSKMSSDSVSGQRRLLPDCAYAQAVMGLRCPHMSEGTFSHSVAQNWSKFGVGKEVLKE